MADELHGRVRAAIEQMTDAGEIPGATWAFVSGEAGARQVHVESAGVYADDTIFRIASLTKPIAGVLTAAVIADGTLALSDAVTRWIPEIAERPVLRTPSSPLDDAVPAARALTVADVLEMGAGLGWGESVTGSPLQQAVADQGLESTWIPSALDPDTWASRLGSLPMAHQPGQGWLYQMSYDLLTIVLERATGTPVDALLAERVLQPLGMTDTGWTVAADQLDRVPAQFFPNRAGRRVQVAPAADPALLRRPAFCSLATGLLSTAGDLARFGVMLLDDGLVPDGNRILPAGTVAAMARDHRTAEAAAMGSDMLGAGRGWGHGVGVDLVERYPGSHAGRFGWDGGTGTTQWTDPVAGLSAVMLTQHGMGGTTDAPYLDRFWTAVHAS